MVKALKSYWAFTGSLYKLVMLVIIPVLFIVLNIIKASEEYGNGLLSVMILYIADTMFDIFFLSGIYRKSNSALEFLQSSPRFADVMREITIVDMVRRILLYHIPLVVTWICSIGNTEKLAWCMMDAFVTWLAIWIAQIVIFAARHFVLWNQVYACAMFGYATWAMIFIAIKTSDISHTIVNVISVTLILITGIATVWYTDKKVKESYYDK